MKITDEMIDNGCEAMKEHHTIGRYGECPGIGWGDASACLEAALKECEHIQNPNFVYVPREVLDFYDFAEKCLVAFTPQQEEIMISLRKARAAVAKSSKLGANHWAQT